MKKLSAVTIGTVAAMSFATAANAELFRLKCSGYGGEMTISTVPEPDMTRWRELCGTKYYWSEFTDQNIMRYCDSSWMIKEWDSSRTVCSG